MHKNTPDIKNHINSQYDESYDRVKYLKDQYKGETAYILASVGMYMGNLQVAGIAFGFGATLGFIRRLARIWE